MAYTFFTVANETLRRINEVELTSSTFSAAKGVQALVKDAINNSQRDIFTRDREWTFAYGSTSQTLTAGTQEYAVTTGFMSVDIDTVLIDRNDSLNVEERKLIPLTYDEYIDNHKERDEQRDSGDYDTPIYVYLTPDYKIGVSPRPDKAYVIKYTYYKSPTDLEASGSVPEVPAQYKNTLIDGALYHLYMMRDNIEQADRSSRAFEEGIDYMRSTLINRYIRMRDTRVKDTVNDR